MKSLFSIPKQDVSKNRVAELQKKVNNTVQPQIVRTVKSSKDSVIDRLNNIKLMVNQNLGKYKDDYIVIRDESQFIQYIDNCIVDGECAIDTETSGLSPILDDIAGMSIYSQSQKAAYIPIHHKSYITGMDVDNQLTTDFLKTQLQRLVDNNVKIIMFNAKFDIRFINNKIGVKFHCYFDSYLAARLLNENEESNALKKLHNKYVLNGESDAFTFDELFEGFNFQYIPINTGYIYAARDAEITYQLYQHQLPYLTIGTEQNIEYELDGVSNVFWNIEMPVLDAFIALEDTGVALDIDFCDQLHDKYTELLKQREQEFWEICNNYNNEIDAYRRLHRTDCKLDNPINIGSPAQIAILLYDILQLPPTKKYGRTTGEDAIKALDHPICKAILNYRGVVKLLSTYIDKMPGIAINGRIYAGYKQIGADTGRVSCISKGTMISCPDGDKPIESLSPGQYLYNYDDNGKLCLDTVKNLWYTGNRKCVKLLWVSKYDKSRKGELICTPDHFIKTINGWKMACELTPNDRIYFVHRRVGNNSVALYGNFGQGSEEEHAWVKYNYFKNNDSSLVVHHKDFNRLNNSPDNLVLCSGTTHTNCHIMSDDISQHHYNNRYNFTRDEIIKMCSDVNWELKQVPYDYSCLIRWLKNYKINYIQAYTESYSKRTYSLNGDTLKKPHHLPMNNGNLRYALDLADGNVYKASGYFGVTSDIFVAQCDKYKLLDNYIVYSIEYLEQLYDVYDIEVTNVHSFIANELCVHNSENPNLQNIPSHAKEIRQMFKADDGYIMLSSDYSAQEPRLTAHLSNDQKMIQAYKDGKDLYSEIASLAFDMPYEDCREFDKDGNFSKEGKERRGTAKVIVLGVSYGMGIKSIAEGLKVSVKKAQTIYNKVMQEFPGLQKFVEDNKTMAREKGYVTTVWGRKRRLPDMQLSPYEIELKPIIDNFDPLSDDNEPEYADDATVQYYIDKLEHSWGSAKYNIIAEAEKDGIKITDNTGKIAQAERQSTNARIQGSAADQTKMAMILINNDELMKKLGFKMLIPVHDEIVGEAPIENAKEAGKRLSELMIEAAKDLKVPSKCDVEYFYNWAGETIEIN